MSSTLVLGHLGVLIGLIAGLIVGFISGWDKAFQTGVTILWITELLIGPLFGIIALPHIHFDQWPQSDRDWLEELEEDELWHAAPAGEAVIGLGQ